MEFFEAVRARRSVRKFKPEPVPEAAVEKALEAALLAPNSSNIQAWEFYWVRTPAKKEALVKACFSQGAASTAAELIVAVSRVDTWKRNRNLVLEDIKKLPNPPKSALDYYSKVIPLLYLQDPFGLLGVLKWAAFTSIGLFRPMARSPKFRYELFEVVTKSTALACENLMLALASQGYGSCPMEGFDEVRVKKILGLGRKAHVVMVIGVGVPDPAGILPTQFRIPKDLVVFKI
jgi:nitroreductase